MGFEPENEPSSTPKLSLFSLPSKPHESPGILLLTPPPCGTTASVPFQWEEAPGKPRPCTTTTGSKPRSARPLELPPRLLCDQTKITDMPSPTTVLDGPYVGRSVSHRFSFTSAEGGPGKRVAKERGLEFTSMRWGSFRKNKGVLQGAFDFSSSVVDGGGDGGGEGETRVKIQRVKRKGSFLSLSHTKSHLLASIYESFKQVVPWRSRQERLGKMA